MHGTGNDFVFYVDLDERTKPEDVRKICDRHTGVGADGVITVTKSRTPKAQYRMKYFNADGSNAEMCGNGIRCFAKYLVDNKLVTDTKKIPVDTDAGILIPEVLKNTAQEAIVKVDMGIPILGNPKQVKENPGKDGLVRLEFLLNGEGKKQIKLKGLYVSMGNPHAIFFVKKGLAEKYTEEFGPQIEKNTKIFPQKTNVEFVEVNNEKDLTLHVWERGSGLTLSCGTGACATLVAAVLNGYVSKSAKLRLPGGVLEVEWSGEHSSVLMTGPVVSVFNISNLNLS